MSKIVPIGTKIYKPEDLNCPFCKSKMVYKHTVSNKVIQFTSSKKIRIRNLGYGCLKCNNKYIYFSQTAAKMCFKGYTYSTKTICTILFNKAIGKNRDEIAKLLSGMDILISERNIDNIYHRFEVYFKEPFSRIEEEYRSMLATYGQIRLSMDTTAIDKYQFICVRNYFTADVIGFHMVELDKQEVIINIVKRYLDSYEITCIATIRRHFPFYKLLSSLVGKNVKLIEFAKF